MLKAIVEGVQSYISEKSWDRICRINMIGTISAGFRNLVHHVNHVTLF